MWAHLGPSYIRPNQSAMRSKREQNIEIKHEHKDIYSKVHKKLVQYHHVPSTHPILCEYSSQLLQYFNDRYFTPLPYKDHIQAREQAHTASSIRHESKQQKLIIRITDKSNNFYVGSRQWLHSIGKFKIISRALMLSWNWALILWTKWWTKWFNCWTSFDRSNTSCSGNTMRCFPIGKQLN